MGECTFVYSSMGPQGRALLRRAIHEISESEKRERERKLNKRCDNFQVPAHHQRITQPIRHLGECVGRERAHHTHIAPVTKRAHGLRNNASAGIFTHIFLS